MVVALAFDDVATARIAPMMTPTSIAAAINLAFEDLLDSIVTYSG